MTGGVGARPNQFQRGNGSATPPDMNHSTLEEQQLPAMLSGNLCAQAFPPKRLLHSVEPNRLLLRELQLNLRPTPGSPASARCWS